ncbi:MAG: GNAT family N-acetyltransferase, partial [Terriglobales bacterium]
MLQPEYAAGFSKPGAAADVICLQLPRITQAFRLRCREITILALRLVVQGVELWTSDLWRIHDKLLLTIIPYISQKILEFQTVFQGTVNCLNAVIGESLKDALQQCTIRPSTSEDSDSLWAILEPIVRAGDVYSVPQNMSREEALAFWRAGDSEVYVAELDGKIAGTYYLRANQKGGGAHVANGGYATASWALGRGVARTMCAHSIARAKEKNFLAMQFNFVVSINERAVR